MDNHLQNILKRLAAFCIPNDGDIITIHMPNEFFRREKCTCGGQLIQTYTNENDLPKDPMKVKFGGRYNFWKEPGMCTCSACKRMYGLDPISRTLLADYVDHVANHRIVLMRSNEDVDLKMMYDHDSYLPFFPDLVIPAGTVLVILEAHEFTDESFLIYSKEILELKEYFPRKDAFDEVQEKIAFEKGKFKPGMVKVPREGAWDKRTGFMTYVLDGILDSGLAGFYISTESFPDAYSNEQRKGFAPTKLSELLEIMNETHILDSITKDPDLDE